MSDSATTYAMRLTAPGMGAIGVVRVTGGDVLTVLGRVARGRKVATLGVGGQVLSAMADSSGEVLDEGLVVRTAESTYELHVHGGVALMEAMLEALRAAGARVVSPREAADHGAMDAQEVELLEALSQATTHTALRLLLAQRQLLGDWVGRWRCRTAPGRPDEGLWPLQTAAQWVLDRSHALAWLLDAPRVAIIGAPNTGKSTLANALLGRPMSITSQHAGTTRDWVDARAVISAPAAGPRDLAVAVEVVLVDTAGVRQTTDPLETEAIARAHSQAQAADVLVVLFDATGDPLPTDLALLERYRSGRLVTAASKMDLVGALPVALAAIPGVVPLSARTRAGLDRLMAAVLEQLGLGAVGDSEVFAYSARQRRILDQLAAEPRMDACLKLLDALENGR